MLPLDVRGLLQRFGLQPKKGLGQNFLVDESALRKIVAAAALQPTDTVLEIGPGLGSLTRHLAQAVQRVVAVELDTELLPILEHVLAAYGNAEVVAGDILQLNPQSLHLPANYKVVANIPYYITSAVIRHLLEAPPVPSEIVLTIQREVAERICAQPGNLSLLAVSVQFYSQPKIVARLPAGAFHPRPQVDSAVLHLAVLPTPAVAVPAVDEFFTIVKAGFGQKRKQLHNALASGLHLGAPQVAMWLGQAGIAPQRRAETLTLAEWGALANTAPSLNPAR